MNEAGIIVTNYDLSTKIVRQYNKRVITNKGDYK